MLSKTTDDIGTGQYDYMGVHERIPLHAKKAEEFQAAGDRFNAIQHARVCGNLCRNNGMIGTGYYDRANIVLAAYNE